MACDLDAQGLTEFPLREDEWLPGFKSHYYSLDTLFWANYINSLYFNSLLYNGTVS